MQKTVGSDKTYVVLHCCLGFEPGIAHVGIIKVIEGWHTMATLSKGSQGENI